MFSRDFRRRLLGLKLKLRLNFDFKEMFKSRKFWFNFFKVMLILMGIVILGVLGLFIYFGKDLESGKMMLTIIVKNQNGYAVYRFEKINLKYFIWDGIAKKRVFESDDKEAVLMEYEKKEYDDDKYCVLRESKNKI